MRKYEEDHAAFTRSHTGHRLPATKEGAMAMVSLPPGDPGSTSLPPGDPGAVAVHLPRLKCAFDHAAMHDGLPAPKAIPPEAGRASRLSADRCVQVRPDAFIAHGRTCTRNPAHALGTQHAEERPPLARSMSTTAECVRSTNAFPPALPRPSRVHGPARPMPRPCHLQPSPV